MLRRLLLIITLVGALVAGGAATPRQAAAVDNLEYIIPAAVAGVVAIVVIVAIVMADRSEPEFELDRQPPAAAPAGGLRLMTDCPMTASGRPLVCW
ncbi:MAG: hypothetical protein ACRERC_00980 [Candidatus Binatia bacterium]